MRSAKSAPSAASSSCLAIAYSDQRAHATYRLGRRPKRIGAPARFFLDRLRGCPGMQFSIFLPTGFAQEFARIADPVQAYQTLTEIATAAEKCRYQTLWTPDHHTTIPPSQEMVFEAWSIIAALARDTSRIRLGQLVTSNSYRNPALQAKMASTVDVLSGGRLTFGIGAGWYEPDCTGC